MTIYNIADILTGLVEAVLLFRLYETFCEKRENFSSGIYVLGIFALAIMINISNVIFGNEILNAVGMAISFFNVSFLFNGKLSIKIIVLFLTIVLIGILEILVMFSITIIYGVTVSEAVNIPSYKLLGIIISKMLTLFMVNVIYIKFKKKRFYIGTSYCILFILMFATSLMAIFLIFKLSFNVDNLYMYDLSILCSFGLLFSTIFALYLYEHLTKQAETIKNHEQYQQHLKNQLKHLDEILITQKQIKKFKHDFNNYIIGLKGYIKNKNFQGANDYIEELEKKCNYSKETIETGNTALDAILSTKTAIAENKKISVSMKIQIPEKITIDPIDMCIIFGNALDNAIEACERTEAADKKISITIICKDKAVFCKIVNTAPKRKSSMLFTSKEDKQNHGFGFENIKTALAKYNATPNVERTDSEFTLKFVIFTEE